jgi:hypothetical protein
MHALLNLLKICYNNILGWLEVTFTSTPEFKYAIIRLESRYINRKQVALVHYKVVGSRVVLIESAFELNKSGLFAMFRKDEAQIIISLATIESMLGLSQEEILDKYNRYLSACINNFSPRNLEDI